MEYDEFKAQYQKAHHDWGVGDIDTAAATVEITRLRTLAEGLEDESDRKFAAYNLSQFEAEISPASQDRMARAVEVVGAAGAGDGTVDERIARAERGIVEVTRIAEESSDQAERFAILQMNDSLASLVNELEHLRRSGEQ